jgi:tight adherence protein B
MFVAALSSILVLMWGSIPIRRCKNRVERLDEARFLGAIAAELRTGASLRTSLAAAAGESPQPALQAVHRLTLSGAPLATIAELLSGLPISGRSLRVALRVAAVTGGRAAGVFERLGERAIDEAALARERRTLTVQARSSAAVVVALPVLSLMLGGAARIGELITAGGGGAIVAATGLAMQIAGAAAVWRVATT